ncbi:MAG: hypothetical protein AB7O43_17365 [Hyphomicrobiaceae bacterium]
MSTPISAEYRTTPPVAADNTDVGLQADVNGNLKVTVAGASSPAVASATTASVASSASSTTIAAANSARQALSIYNDDANALLIKYGATASASSYKVRIPGGGYWERPPDDRYTGIIDGIWEADGSGSARVTEL